MLKTSKSQTLNGSSVIKVENVEQIAASMNGTVNADSTISFNWYISNKDLYEANKTEVQKDLADFQKELLDMAEEN